MQPMLMRRLFDDGRPVLLPAGRRPDGSTDGVVLSEPHRAHDQSGRLHAHVQLLHFAPDGRLGAERWLSRR